MERPAPSPAPPAGPAGTFRQRTQITDTQQDILTRLGIDSPPRIYQLTPTAPR